MNLDVFLMISAARRTGQHSPWPGPPTLCTRTLPPSPHGCCWLLQVGTCTQFRPGPSSLGPRCVPDTKATVKNKSNPCPLRGGQHPGKSNVLGDVHRGAMLPPRLTHPAALIQIQQGERQGQEQTSNHTRIHTPIPRQATKDCFHVQSP